MLKYTYKNVTRFPLPVILKTEDQAKTYTLNIVAGASFQILEPQKTGDIEVKVQNRLLKCTASEEAFSAVGMETKKEVVPQVVPLKIKKDFKPTKLTVTTKEIS